MSATPPVGRRQLSRGGRRGFVFSIRLTAEELAELAKAAYRERPWYTTSPALGPWIKYAALERARDGAAKLGKAPGDRPGTTHDQAGDPKKGTTGRRRRVVPRRGK